MTRTWIVFLIPLVLPAPALAFPHRTHLSGDLRAACTACHPASADADRLRPANRDHSACDGASCHAAEFYGQKAERTDVCRSCHEGTDYWRAQKTLPFPSQPDLDRRDWFAEFPHRLHLKKGGPAAERDMACTQCHEDVREAARKPERVLHSACAACHTDLMKAPMSKCEACHRFRRDERGRPVPTGPELAHRPERVTAAFDHFKHRFDRRKTEAVSVGCDACHPQVEQADTLAAIQPTHGRKTMVGACGACHKRGQKTADGRKLFTITGSCTKCHSKAFARGLLDVPADHRG